MLERVNFLWDSNELYTEWVQSLNERPREYIEDLNLEHIFEELNSISSFMDFSIHKKVFIYPCTSLSTIQYRQTIIKTMYENKRLHKTIKDFVVMLRDVHKNLITINKTKDEVKKSIFFLQLYYEFITKLQDFYNLLVKLIPDDNILNKLTTFLTEYVQSPNMIDARHSIHQLLTKLDSLYSFFIILNKKSEQKIYSSAIDDNTEADYNSMENYANSSDINFSENLSKLSNFILDDYDFNISVYQDMDITTLDKALQSRVMNKEPEISNEISRLYLKYKDFPFYSFFDMSDDLIFYITYVDFMYLYEQAGFYFTLPVHSPYKSQISAEGAYDLSLAINRYKSNKLNNLVSNTCTFDEANRIFILTGANQGGKTTFLRSIGIIQCLYQIGVYVPATHASLSLVNQVYTHFSRADEAITGAGRFEQELIMLQGLLSKIKPYDMVLLNEPFTSTQRSIAVVLLKQAMLEFSKKKCFGGLVTHFFELINKLPNQPFFSLVTIVNQNDRFSERTYQITKRPSDNRSHADDIARKCGVTYEELLLNIMDKL